MWSRFNLSSALVVVEIGLSLVLLVGGGLLARSFIALQRVDPGFEADSQLTFRLRLSGTEYADRATRIAFNEQLEERLEAIPGIDAVGTTSILPFAQGVLWLPIGTESYVPPQGEDHQIISELRFVTPTYFEAMGIPLIRGRGFDERDRLDAAPVAMIDKSFAETYFPQRNPIGTQLRWGGGKVAIIGVVGTVKHESLDSDSRVTTYIPNGQLGVHRLYLAIRAAGDPAALVAPVTRAVHELDDNLVLVDVLPMRSRLADSLAERRFSMTLLQVLGAMALVLASVGVYGLVAYRVNEGAHELGLRMALGATTRTILKLVLRHGLTLASAGVASGLAAALAVTGLMRSMLFGVSTVDPWTFATVSAGLVMTALIACYIPARRATRLDPLDALKTE